MLSNTIFHNHYVSYRTTTPLTPFCFKRIEADNQYHCDWCQGIGVPYPPMLPQCGQFQWQFTAS